MSFTVHAETTTLTESFLAPINPAKEGFLSTVCIFVLTQVLSKSERFIAHRAMVLANALVDEVMVSSKRKATLEYLSAVWKRADEVLLFSGFESVHKVNRVFML